MNKSNDLREDITEVVKTCKVSTEDFHLISLYKYEDVLVSILNKFTVLGKKGIGCNWWWNDFKKPTASVHHEYPPGILEQLIPSEEKVWFIVEDTHSGKQNGFHWLYEGKVETVVSIIGETHGFEYYIASKKLQWLIGETHHDVLVGTGDYIVAKIESYKNQRK